MTRPRRDRKKSPAVAPRVSTPSPPRRSVPPTPPSPGSAPPPPPSAPGPASRRPGLTALLALLLFCLVVAVFGQVRTFGFLHYDDDQYVRDTPQVATGLSADNLSWLLTHSHVGQWHPLTTLSMMVDASLFGTDHPSGFHLDNLLLHALAAVLLFFALRSFTGALWRSALVAALFALHPLRAESVAWIAERKDVLSGVFLMTTLWAYSAYARRPFSLPRYALLWLSFALGLLAKPILVTLPAVLLLLDIWPLRRLEITADLRALWRQARPLLLEKLPLLVLSLAATLIALRIMDKPYFYPIPRLEIADRLSYIPANYLFYLGKLLWPLDLAPHYPYSLHGASTPAWLASLLVLLVLTALVLGLFRRLPALTIGWLWFLGTLLPVVGFFYSGIQIRADRYTYLSEIGLVWAAVWIIAAALEKRPLALRLAAALLPVALLATLCVLQTAHWKDDQALWTRTVAATRDNFYAQAKLGTLLAADHDLPAAEKAFRESLRIYPDGIEASNNLANLLRATGRLDEAIALQRRTVALMPTWFTVHYNLACLLLQKGDLPASVAAFEKALALSPGDFGSTLNLANIYSADTRNPDHLATGLRYARLALAARPANPDALITLGRAQYFLGQTDDAIASFRQALAAAPSSLPAATNLAVALGTRSHWPESIALFLDIIKRAPDDIDAYRNLAEILLRKGSVADAITTWKAALQRSPDDRLCLNRLAWTLATTPQAPLRDGPTALRLATRLDTLAAGADPDALNILAAAQAETGDYTAACVTIDKALALPAVAASPPATALLRQRLALYASDHSYRDTPAP